MSQLPFMLFPRRNTKIVIYRFPFDLLNFFLKKIWKERINKSRNEKFNNESKEKRKSKLREGIKNLAKV